MGDHRLAHPFSQWPDDNMSPGAHLDSLAVIEIQDPSFPSLFEFTSLPTWPPVMDHSGQGRGNSHSEALLQVSRLVKENTT